MVVAEGTMQGWEPIAPDIAANLTQFQHLAEALNISLIPLIFPFSVPEYTIYASSPLGAELAEPLFSAGAPFVVSADGSRLDHAVTSFMINGNLNQHDEATNTFAGWTLQYCELQYIWQLFSILLLKMQKEWRTSPEKQ